MKIFARRVTSRVDPRVSCMYAKFGASRQATLIGPLSCPNSARLYALFAPALRHTTPAFLPESPNTHWPQNLIGPEACRRHRGVAVVNANCCKFHMNPTLSQLIHGVSLRTWTGASTISNYRPQGFGSVPGGQGAEDERGD